jgi:hypothetical protein
VRVFLAATSLLVVALTAAPALTANGKRTAACKTIVDVEALIAMGAKDGYSGFGHDWPIQQIPGTRRFRGREVSCQWASDTGLGNIDLGIFVLPTRAEATRYYRAWNPVCPKPQRVNVGAGGCGAAGILRAHWGRFALGLGGALSNDGSVMSGPALEILAKRVFSRAPRVFAGR